MLPGTSSNTSGAPGLTASLASVTAGSGSIVEVDRFRRFLGLHRGRGDHAGHRIADEPDLVGRERRPRRLVHRRAVAILQRGETFQRAVTGGRKFRAGIDREHPRHRQRRRSADALDHPVGMAGPYDRRIGLAGKVHIVGIAALALHQNGVLGARNRLADTEFLHGPGIRIILNIHENSLKSRVTERLR
jgi:hypothetical protein